MSDQQDGRSDEEIIRYYEKTRAGDIFGVWGTELLIRLPLHKAQRFMAQNHGWTDETWARAMRKKDPETIKVEIDEFIQFAIEKTMTHAGKAAAMAVHNYRAWAWLLDDMDLFSYLIDERNFPNCGAPMFLAVMEKYGLLDFLPDKPIHKEMFLRMAQGNKCTDLCVRGCGKSNPKLFANSGAFRQQTSGLIVPK